MGNFLDFWARHAAGVFVFVATVAAVLALFVWSLRKVMKLFSWGMYRSHGAVSLPIMQDDSSIARLLTEFFMKIISEFRHFLALLIFILFAAVLVYGVHYATDPGYPSLAGIDANGANQIVTARIDAVGRMVQVIIASLGGLVGSIIGYYFGEAGAKKVPPTGDGGTTQTPEQTTTVASGVTQAKSPPN